METKKELESIKICEWYISRVARDIEFLRKRRKENVDLIRLFELSLSLYENFKKLRDGWKEIQDFREFTSFLPFRVVIKILTYYSYPFSLRRRLSSVNEFYGYFTLDKFRKLFLIFRASDSYVRARTLRFLPVKFQGCLCVSKAILSRVGKKEYSKFNDLKSIRVIKCQKFPDYLNQKSYRSIRTVEISSFDPNQDLGYFRKCKNMRSLSIYNVVNSVAMKVLLNPFTEFKKLVELEILDSSNIGMWNFKNLISLKRFEIVVSDELSFYQINSLLDTSVNLEVVSISNNNVERSIVIDGIYLFLLRASKLRYLGFDNVKSRKWEELNWFEEENENLIEEFRYFNYQAYSTYCEKELFEFLCKRCKRITKLLINLPSEGELVDSLDILNGFNSLKFLELNYTLKSKLNESVISYLGACAKSLKRIEFLSIEDVEDRFQLLSPSEFLNLRVVSFFQLNHLQKRSCGIGKKWIETMTLLPNLSILRLNGIVRSEDWYKLFKIPRLVILEIGEIDSKILKSYKLLRDEAFIGKEDSKIREKFKIVCHKSLEILNLTYPNNYPWIMIEQLVEKCKKLVKINLYPIGVGVTKKLEYFTIHVIENVRKLPNLEKIGFIGGKELIRYFKLDSSVANCVVRKCVKNVILNSRVRTSKEKIDSKEESIVGEFSMSLTDGRKTAISNLKKISRKFLESRRILLKRKTGRMRLKEIEDVISMMVFYYLLSRAMKLKILGEYFDWDTDLEDDFDYFGYFIDDPDRNILQIFRKGDS